jgi:2-polyprenyl-3-methyl-5-hydroxy-6-metoxy-1,4-benzoquinol methylase
MRSIGGNMKLNRVKDQYKKIANFCDSDSDHFKDSKKIDFLVSSFRKNGITSILDVGCGTGDYAIPLAERGYEVTGIDASKERISIANQR